MLPGAGNFIPIISSMEIHFVLNLFTMLAQYGWSVKRIRVQPSVPSWFKLRLKLCFNGKPRRQSRCQVFAFFASAPTNKANIRTANTNDFMSYAYRSRNWIRTVTPKVLKNIGFQVFAKCMCKRRRTCCLLFSKSF